MATPPDGGSAAIPGAVDGGSSAGAIGPVPVQAFALSGADEVPLAMASEPTAVDPISAFRIEAGAELVDAHAVLLDDKDDMVPSTGTTELGQTSRFHLAPREPLRAGSRYTLRVETEGGRELRDTQGHRYAPASVGLKTAGEKPASPGPAKKAKRSRHRR